MCVVFVTHTSDVDSLWNELVSLFLGGYRESRRVQNHGMILGGGGGE